MASAETLTEVTETVVGIRLELSLREAQVLRHLLKHVGGWDGYGGVRQTLNGILDSIHFVRGEEGLTEFSVPAMVKSDN